MDFEIFCFGLENFSDVVHKEYVSTYAEALAFEKAEQDNYSGISITPMNEQAEHEMACAQCKNTWLKNACKRCPHNR